MQPVVPESAIFGGRCADAVLGMRGQGQGCGLPLAETRDAGVCVWPQSVLVQGRCVCVYDGARARCVRVV